MVSSNSVSYFRRTFGVYAVCIFLKMPHKTDMSNQSTTTVHILQPAESALMHNTICDDEHVQGFQQDK